ncbi:MAG: hypothetical protein K2K80_06395, partial [Clostridia bacterium]|nr:hypothetical protein [Clostridia bacterium]
DRIALKKDTVISLYLDGELMSFWISGSCVDVAAAGEGSSKAQLTSATVTKDAKFEIYLKDYSSETNPNNWSCEFIGTPAILTSTAELPANCEGVKIAVGETEEITLYFVDVEGNAINAKNAANFQVHAWNGGTNLFGAWANNPTLDTKLSIAADKDDNKLYDTTNWIIHWQGGQSSTFSGLVAGKAYLVNLKLDGKGDCVIDEYTGEAHIMTPAEAPSEDVDVREFYARGNGKSPALAGWNDAGDKMTKAEDKNEYTITMDVYAGDMFQFTVQGSWAEQHGAGYLATNKIGETEHFKADTNKKANIECLVTGNYTFKLTTNPVNGDEDTITWTYNGDVVAAVEDTVTHFYIKGDALTLAGGWNEPAGETTELKAKAGEDGVYEMTIELKAGALMFYSREVGVETGAIKEGTAEIKADKIDDDSKQYVGNTAGEDGKISGDIVIANAGSYTFTYNSATQKLTIAFVAADAE